MTVIARSAVVSYTPAQMFDLVENFEAYPEFVPWCTKSILISRNHEEVKAGLEFTKSGIRHSFSTINRLKRNDTIEMSLLEGPFRKLEGFWRFDSMDKGCKVNFEIEFVLANRFLDLAVGPFLQGVTGEFVAAFTERAKHIYDRCSAE